MPQISLWFSPWALCLPPFLHFLGPESHRYPFLANHFLTCLHCISAATNNVILGIQGFSCKEIQHDIMKDHRFRVVLQHVNGSVGFEFQMGWKSGRLVSALESFIILHQVPVSGVSISDYSNEKGFVAVRLTCLWLVERIFLETGGR